MPYRIGPYENPGAVCLPHNPRALEAARELIRLIQAQDPSLAVEHVGSSSVPGCDGKGILDLLVMYEPGALEKAKQALAELGFQKQTSRDPWPEERPMRVGSLEFEGRTFPIHAHVLARGTSEAAELIWFRERLRADPDLRDKYAARKRAIIRGGVADSIEYSIKKGSFVQDVIDSGKAEG
jgi:GrpB-like predicted nucleotidyltransferase (UPF0157 family)